MNSEIMLIYIIKKEKLNPLSIYKKINAISEINSLNLFDEKFYLERYSDVKDSKISPLCHYIYHGYKEKRIPSKKFDGNYYLEKYPDVEESGQNPLIHYIIHGKNEGKFPNRKKELNSPENKIKTLKQSSESKIKSLKSKVRFLKKELNKYERAEKSKDELLKLELNRYEQININNIHKEKIDSEIENIENKIVLKENRSLKLIISLTSSPTFMYNIHYCLYSLLTQTCRADKVILWLNKKEFPNLEKNLPKKVIKLKNYGLVIKWYEDIENYKELIPTLKKYPNDIIITAKDNIFYPKNWLEQLYNEYDGENIIAHRVKEIKTNIYGRFVPSSWKIKKLIEKEKPSIINFPDAKGGVLYPPNSIHSDILNSSELVEIEDNLYFWAMSVINGKKIKAIPEGYFNLNYINPPKKYFNDEKELKNKNNDIIKDTWEINSIKKLLNYYPELLEKIKEEIRPKVSVIIPVYNSKYLEQCLFSVANQTLKEIEIICVNNESDYKSSNILKKFAKEDERIVIITQNVQDIDVACDNGIKNINGEYTIFLSPKDWLDARALEILYLNAKEKFSDVTFFKIQCFDENNEKMASWSYYSLKEIRNMYKKEVMSNKIIAKNLFKISTNLYDKFYNTSFLNNINPQFYKGDNLSKNCFNYDVFLNSEKISMVQKGLCFHRTHIGYNNSYKLSDYKKIIEISNKIINSFKKNNAYNKHLSKLLNYKIGKIRKSYENINKKNKHAYFSYIKKDFIKISNNHITNNEYIENLNEKNLEFYLNITGSELKDLNGDSLNSLKNNTLSSNSRDKKALIIEPNNFHGEIIPTYAKYLTDLKYDVNIIMMEKNHDLEPLERCNNDKIHVSLANYAKLREFLSSYNNLNKYDVIIFTTSKDYKYREETDHMSVFKVFPLLNNPKIKNKIIVVEHNFLITSHLKELLNNNQVITLSNLGYEDIVVSNFYYGNIEITNKNTDKTIFIMVGNLESKRRNWNLLIHSVEELDREGYDNFKIVVVGGGDFGETPQKIRRYFEVMGKLSYPNMYIQIEKSDFILPMLDYKNPEHDRYLTTSQSGSFSLIYGFKKPTIVNKKFSEKYKINEENSIIYEKNKDLTKSMKKAILMNKEEYSKLQNNLGKIAKETEEKSFYNFQKIINGIESKNKPVRSENNN